MEAGLEIGDALTARLLSRVQRAFPLDPRPFAALGEALGLPEEQLLARISELKAQRIIRQISGIFDSRRLGYQSCLVAAQVPSRILEQAAAAINRHPGVSHNYERAHAFNLWFTLTVPGHADLPAEAARLGMEAGAIQVRLFPTVRTFKIGVILDVGGNQGAGPTPPATAAASPSEYAASASAKSLSAREIAAVRALQKDLPLVARPFHALANEAGMAEEELLAHARQFLEGGEMRRFAAVLFHRRAGFTANGMVVWNVPAERVVAVGQRFAAYPAVSHCYQRPCYPDWPYSLFTMIHARSQEECERLVREMANAVDIHEHAILYSLREFKKTRVRYFEESLPEQPPQETRCRPQADAPS